MRAVQRLAVIEKPFRGLIEEQYGHVLWTTLICRNMKIPLDVLLMGRGARLAVVRQSAMPKIELTKELDVTLADSSELIGFLINSGSRIFVDKSHLPSGCGFLEGVEIVDRTEVVDLIATAKRTWFW